MNESEAQEPLPDLFRKPVARPVWRRCLFLVAAIVLFAIGLLTVVIPGIIGPPFHIAALICLAIFSERVRQWLNAWERRLSLRHRLTLRSWLRKVPIRRIREMGEVPGEPREGRTPEVAGSAREPSR